jgi:hypothetical protein
VTVYVYWKKRGRKVEEESVAYDAEDDELYIPAPVKEKTSKANTEAVTDIVCSESSLQKPTP